MWIFSTAGFVSIVRKGREGEFQVRSRERTDLENICDLIQMTRTRILTTLSGDYSYRLILDANELGQVFDALKGTIDYPNYKNSVAGRKDQRKKIGALHEIWGIMAATQQVRPWSGRRQERGEPSLFDGPSDDEGEDSNGVEPLAPANQKKREGGRN